MQSLIDSINSLINEVRGKENSDKSINDLIDKLFFKKNLCDAVDLLSLKPSELMLIILLAIKTIDDEIDFEAFESIINKISKNIDSFDPIDLAIFFSAFEEFCDDDDLFEENCRKLRKKIEKNQKNIFQNEVFIDTSDYCDVLANHFQNIFNNKSEIEEFLKLLPQLFDVNLLHYPGKDKANQPVKDLYMNFSELMGDYARLKNLNINKPMARKYLDPFYWQQVKSIVKTANSGQLKYNSKEFSFAKLVGRMRDFMDDLGDEFTDQLDVLNLLYLYLEKIFGEQKKKNRDFEERKRRVISNLSTVSLTLASESLSEQIDFNFTDIKGDLLNSELLHQIYLKVFGINSDSYSKLKQEYTLFERNEYTELESLLAKYDLSISNTSYKNYLIENLSLEDIKNKCELLHSKKFKNIKRDDDTLFNILCLSDIFSLETVNKYLDFGTITEEFVYDNIEILFVQNNESYNSKFHLFNNNINLFIRTINSSLLKDGYLDLLLCDNNYLTSMLNILKKYGFDLKNQTQIVLPLLQDFKQLDVIDSFMEFGLNDYLQENIDLALFNKKLIGKLYVYKEMAGVDVNVADIKKLTTETLYGVNDSEIGNYYYNDCSNYYNPEIINVLETSDNINISKEIDSYISFADLKSTDYLFNINGVNISKNKVLRCLTTLLPYVQNGIFSIKEALLNSLMYNSILNEEETKIIIDYVNEKALSL